MLRDNTLTDVATVSLTDFKGAVILAGDVESFTSNSLVSLSVTAGASLETVDVTGAIDPDATTAATKLGPAISLDTLGDLETVTIAGIAPSVNIGSNGNLTTLTISADVAGAITIDNNTDLETVTLTGAKAYSLDVDTNSDLAALTVDLTWRGNGVLTVIDGTLDVTDNESLESLTVSSDKLENLTVTGNDDLTTVDFTGVTTIGATGTASVNIWDNDLTATKLTDASDGTTDVANGASGDLGSITSTSGMDTLETYLTAVDADADSAAAVYFDTVESFVAEDDSETADVVYSSNTAENAGTVLLLVANTADTGDAATLAKRSFLIGQGHAYDLTVNQTVISAAGGTTLSSNQGSAINQILTETTLASADAAGFTLTATKYAAPVAYIAINTNSDAAENSYAGVAKTGFAFGVSDSFTLTVDGLSATITSSATGGSTAITDTFVNALVAKWNAEHTVRLSSDATVRWSLATDVTASGDPMGVGGIKITATAKDKGSRDIGAARSASHALGKTTTDSNVGIAIGNAQNFTKSTADNIAQGTEILVTLEADTAGDLLSEVGEYGDGYGTNLASTAGGVSITAAGVIELSSTFAPNATDSNTETSTDAYVIESRLDVILPEEANAAATTNAVSFSRVGWL